MSRNLLRYFVLDINTVLSCIHSELPMFFMVPNKEGKLVRLKIGTFSPRLRTYLQGVDCLSCGAKGAYFAVESQFQGRKKKQVVMSGGHLNLYALRKDGTEVMMTSDHIIPKSKGGAGSNRNRQPLCITCNNEKGDKHVPTSKPITHPRLEYIRRFPSLQKYQARDNTNRDNNQKG